MYESSKSTMNSAIKKIILIIVTFAIIFSLFAGLNTQNVKVEAQSSNLSEELREAERRLAELRRQQEELNKQIQREQQNQNSLAQQSRNLDRTIQQNELQIQAIQAELEKIQLELQILTDEQKKLEARLAEVQEKLKKTQADLKVSLNLLYKMSLNSSSFLEDNINFQESALSQEKERSTIRIIKADLLEVKKLEEEVASKKTEIDTKQKTVADLKSQTEARNENLSNQQTALKWQKENKQRLLNQSQESQDSLRDRREENDQKIKEIDAQRASIIARLTNLPPSNTLVAAGQVIGFQGRSGLSCSWYDPALAPVKTNDYCQKYAGLNSNWYYYEPSKFPTKGSHLHFVYSVGGKQVNADEYIRGSKRNQFTVMPLNPFYVSQGWHDGGAVDLVSAHSAPVYAVKRGFVSYYCSNFPNVPGFPDPLFGAVVHHVDANGKLDGTVSGYWHLQRRGYPCR